MRKRSNHNREQVNTIGYDEDTIPAFDGGDGMMYDFSGINDDIDADVPDDSDMSLSEAPRSEGRKWLVCIFTTFLSHPANNFLHQLSNDPNDVTRPSRNCPKSAHIPVKATTPASDRRASFKSAMTTYRRPPPSASSATTTSTISLSTVRGGTPRVATSIASGPSKGKCSVHQFQSNLEERLSSFHKDTEELKISASTMKMEHYLAKMNFHMKEKEIEFLKEERAGEHADAEVIHCRAQELKQAEIELKLAKAKAYEKEAEALCLKVKLAEMAQSSS